MARYKLNSEQGLTPHESFHQKYVEVNDVWQGVSLYLCVGKFLKKLPIPLSDGRAFERKNKRSIHIGIVIPTLSSNDEKKLGRALSFKFVVLIVMWLKH